MKGDYLMVTTKTDITLYHFDIFSLQYNLNFTKNYTAVNTVDNALLSNGQILIRMFTQTGSADFEVEILALDSFSGTYTSTSHFLGIDTTGFKSLLMAHLG